MSLDFTEFVKLRDKFVEAERELNDLLYNFIIEEALRTLTLTKENTPVDTGYLRNMWQVGDVKRSGQYLIVEIYNNVEYASHVEDGHRQTPGRYVPAIGKRLVARNVRGVHMARLAIKAIEKEMPSRLENLLANWLNSLEEI